MKKSIGTNGNSASSMAGFLSEEQFRRMLARERKRSERSRKHLVLIDVYKRQELLVTKSKHPAIQKPGDGSAEVGARA